jgi:DNA polymerase-1
MESGVLVTPTSAQSSTKPYATSQRTMHVVRMTELRIDADFYLYRACQQNEVDLEWGDDLTTIHSSLKACIKSFTSVINSYVRQFDTSRERVTLFLSTGDNFRKEVCPDYKGTRTKRKPVGYKRLKD